MGRVSIIGEVTGKKYSLRETGDHIAEIYDWQLGKPASINIDHILFNGTDILRYDPTGDRLVSSRDVYSSAIDASLGSHGSRHNRGGADAIDYSLIAKLLLKSASPTLGTGGSLGAEVSIEPDSGYSRIIPLGIEIDVGGTFATGETVTVRVITYFDDGTSAYIDKSFTATGTLVLSESDLRSLWKNGVGITKIGVQAGSSASTTSVTVTVYVRGIQH